MVRLLSLYSTTQPVKVFPGITHSTPTTMTSILIRSKPFAGKLVSFSVTSGRRYLPEVFLSVCSRNHSISSNCCASKSWMTNVVGRTNTCPWRPGACRGFSASSTMSCLDPDKARNTIDKNKTIDKKNFQKANLSRLLSLAKPESSQLAGE